MVCELGMSEMGPVTFGKKEEHIFLGREIAQHHDYSEETAIQIDKEIKRIVMRNYERAKKIIQENRRILDNLAETLLVREVLDGEEIKLILEGKKLPVITGEKPVAKAAPCPEGEDEGKAGEKPKKRVAPKPKESLESI